MVFLDRCLKLSYRFLLIHSLTSDESKITRRIIGSNMNSVTKWGIVGAGTLGVLILIGIIVLLVKCLMKRCYNKAWEDIKSLPKQLDSSDNRAHRKATKHSLLEREPLCPTTAAANVIVTSNDHVTVPIGETSLPPEEHQHGGYAQHSHTLVQIQRDRLNRLKEEENRLRPMICLNNEEDNIKRVIGQAQVEFEESV